MIKIQEDLAMRIRILLVPALTTALMLLCVTALAAEQDQVRGWELMTEQERAEQQDRMRNAITEEEREQIRKETHELMKQRAKERGLTMPDVPSADYGRMNEDSDKDKGH